MLNKIKIFIKFYLLLFYIFVTFIFFLEEKNAYCSEEIDFVPLKFTLYSPYTDFDFFLADNYINKQQNNFLLGILYAESNYLYGLGLSLGVLNTTDAMIGMQISPVNVITGTGMGVQLGLVNYVHDFYGAELGLINNTKNTYGFELGILNFSDDMAGVQVGLINKANNVIGTQIGLINIADEQTGYSFGILNFLLKTGQTKLSYWYDSDVPFNIAIKAGGKYFYSTFEVNFPNLEMKDKNPLIVSAFYPLFYSLYLSANRENYYSLGVGGQVAFEPIWLAIEANWRDLTDNKGDKIDQLKMQYSFLFGTTFESIYDIFGIVSLNSSPLLGKFDIWSPSKYLPDETYKVTLGVGFQVLLFGKPNW